MPKRHSLARKQQALRLLAIHNNNVMIVNHLTGIPRSTLYYWRHQEHSNETAFIGQKNIPSPIESVQHNESSRPPEHPDAELIQVEDFKNGRRPDDPELPPSDTPPTTEPADGVPGRTYPYPLEDDENDADTQLEAFRRVRDILMSHAHQLAASLSPDDPDINRRSLALARILDRIHQLDAMLPDLIPEQVIRYEFVYDDMVHNKPPWKRTEEDLLAQLAIIRERKEDEARKAAVPADSSN